jgi:tripartite-type tricarboxylate transporter receptor subunit TctC
MFTIKYLHYFTVASLGIFAGAATAQSYPAKPVRVIVPYPAGGGLDMIVRPIVQRMADNTKQPFVIDNRSGANGIVGMEFGAKSAPDGYTLISATTGSLTINPAVHARLPFHPVRDFLPISNLGEAPFVLVCHPSLAVHNPRELIALAKKRPGELNYGSPGVGGINHLGMELFAQQSGGLHLLHVTYKGSAPLLIDVMGGHVMLAFDSIQATGPHIKAGKLRALGLGDLKRTPVAPDIPTLTEAGGPAGYRLLSWYGLFAPGGTPAKIVAQAHAETVKALREATLRERLIATGVTPVGNSPQEFAAVVQSDLAKWMKVARAAGVKPQ